MTSKYILICKSCNTACSANLIIEKWANNLPMMGVEIECNCKGKKRKSVYYLFSMQNNIEKSYDIKEKS